MGNQFILPPALIPDPLPTAEDYKADFAIYEEKEDKDGKKVQGKKIGYDFHAAAEHLKDRYFIRKIEGEIRYYDERKGIYYPVGPHFEAMTRFMERMDARLTRHDKQEICKKLEDLVLDDYSGSREYSPVIVFTNCSYDPETNTVHQHSPEDNAVNCIPHAYNPAAYSEAVEKELDLFTEGNKEDKRFVKQILFGYPIGFGYNDMRSFVILVGPPSSGKSQIISMVQGMLGRDDCTPNYSTLAMSKIAERFNVASLVGKYANFDSDISLDYKGEAIVSMIKAITGGDSIGTERKNKDRQDGVKINAKIIFSANDTFRVSDAGRALTDRMLIYKAAAHFEAVGDPHKHLLSEIKTEEAYEYMITIALKALHEIREEGFAIPSESQQEKQHFIRDNEPLNEFLDSIDDIDSDIIGQTVKDTYLMYSVWAREEDIQKPYGKTRFKAELAKILGLTLKRIGPASDRGPEVWQYTEKKTMAETETRHEAKAEERKDMYEPLVKDDLFKEPEEEQVKDTLFEDYEYENFMQELKENEQEAKRRKDIDPEWEIKNQDLAAVG